MKTMFKVSIGVLVFSACVAMSVLLYVLTKPRAFTSEFVQSQQTVIAAPAYIRPPELVPEPTAAPTRSAAPKRRWLALPKKKEEPKVLVCKEVPLEQGGGAVKSCEWK